MGHTACTEPQCLYKGALYLFTLIQLFDLRHVIQQSCVVFSSCTIRNVEGYPNITYNHFLPHY